MRVVIFGGTGFVGSYCTEAMIKSGHEVTLLARPGKHSQIVKNPSCRLVIGDLHDDAFLDESLKEVDAVVFLIGILREWPKSGITFDDLHYQMAVRAINGAMKYQVSRFLLMSANGVHINGVPYQRTKYRAEEYLRKSSLRWTIFRPSVIFGNPHGFDEIASRLCREMVLPPVPVALFFQGMNPRRAGDFRMSPVHVEDVAMAFDRALEDDRSIGQIVALGGPDELSWRQMIEIIAAVVQRKKMMIPVPALLIDLFAKLFDHKSWFPITRDQLHMLFENNVCSPEGLELLDIRPRPFSVDELRYLSQLTEK